jgi:hypothetical protein
MMVTVAGALVVLGLLASVVPGLEDRTDHAAARFLDRHAYVERVLHGAVETAAAPVPLVVHGAPTASVLAGAAGALATVAAVLLGLYRRRLPAVARGAWTRVLVRPLEVLRAAHTGVAGDYVMWLTVGTAVIGGVWALTLR